MGLTGVLLGAFLLFPSIMAHDLDTDTYYLLAVTSQAVGGAAEAFCVTVVPSEIVSLEVFLESDNDTVTILNKNNIRREYYNCVPFQVPVVHVETVVSIGIKIEGQDTYLNKTTKMLITPPTQLVIVKTDKPIYKPGQTVMFRIVSLDTNFLTYNQTFPTVELQDPNSNRIGQWLNVSMWSGLVDLSYPINSEATKGFYTITVWDSENKAITQSFQVKDYVLPTFEVNVSLPPVVTILDTFATLKVCAKYTYGKPVNGTVKARVCHNSIRYWWFIPANTTMPDVCRDLIMKTDRTGCAQHVLNLNDYALTDSRYESSFNVRSEVEEYGTGVTLTGSGSSMITTNIVTLSFEDSPVTFKLGLVYEGKIKVTGPNSIPMVKKAVFLTISYGNRKSLYWKLVTDKNGMAKFSLQTRRWGLQQVSIQAQYETTDTPTVTAGGENQLTPYYPNAYLYIQPFFSESLSFIKLKPSLTPFSCNKNAVIEAQYLIRSDTHTKLKSTVTFYYMVMCKGHLVQRGQLVQPITPGKRQHKGVLQVTLENMLQLSPVAQVVLYTVLPSGEAIADSMNFPIQLYLANKVSLNILNASTLPGDQVTLILKAAPGSLCSVRAIDRSLLLLQPENELSIESLYNMLPVQTLSDYPYNTYDEDSNQCLGSPLILPNRATKLMGYFPVNYGKVDVYSTFKYVGIKILTNTIIAKPTECIIPFRFDPMMGGVALESVVSKATSSAPVQPVVTVRKYFPETWIWDLVVVSPTGAMGAHKTIPDSITTWQVDAFCTSTVGFGIAQKINFTAFQPFFVSLTMPSFVVRGEVFTLMATVFNYLQSCMMVKVTLADSAQFSVRSQPGYSSCLCADESQTVSWSITPLDLGEISFNVTAEAVQSSALCGSSAVVVPEQGAVDTIIKTLLVQAEGTKEYESFNEILCPDGGVVKKTVSLKLPRVFVNGSAMASVSVVGDLMGRALQNLASLLAMPYGCGEQNMMLFAPNIFILQYLESTNQLTPAIRSTAENYLVSGYQRELTYKHTDGSYSAFGMSDASGNTWLTAFVMKSFGNAKRYIFVDQLVVDQAKTWLGQQQQKNGGFASVGQLIHKDMEGGVEDEVSLSAYISAAMMELNYTVTDPVVSKSLVFLRNACHKVTSIYTKALLFYTFTLAGDQKMRKTLMTDLDSSAIVSGQGRLWSRTSNGSVTDSLEVEMTSYVLLALMSGPELAGFNLSYSVSIVRWLSQQQNAFGGFASTQDTVVALQALAKYSVATYSHQGAVTVTVTSPSGLKNTFNVTQSNRLLYQETRLQKASGDYSVSAEGKGCVYVQFTLQYNTPPPPPLAFSSFSVSASASGNCSGPNPSLDLNVTVMYIGPRLETNMVIISVKLLSGFSVDETSVKLLNRNKNSTDGSVKRVDQADGEVNIYLNQLANGSLMEYNLVLMQDFAVKNLKPGIVKVYDYYETGDAAVTDYTSPCT